MTIEQPLHVCWVIITLMKVLMIMQSWKIKPEPTAAIPKGITTGYKEMVTQMHSQTRWSSTIDLISVISFTDPNLFKLIRGSDMIWYSTIFSCFDYPKLQTLLDISFKIKSLIYF